MGQAPTLSLWVTETPASGVIAVAGLSPSLDLGVELTAQAGTLALVGAEPTVVTEELRGRTRRRWKAPVYRERLLREDEEVLLLLL
jgi:hypothetical protein